MAEIKVIYTCGCGFKTENLLEAVLHSDTLKHSLDATGTIQKEIKKNKVGRIKWIV